MLLYQCCWRNTNSQWTSWTLRVNDQCLSYCFSVVHRDRSYLDAHILTYMHLDFFFLSDIFSTLTLPHHSQHHQRPTLLLPLPLPLTIDYAVNSNFGIYRVLFLRLFLCVCVYGQVNI